MKRFATAWLVLVIVLGPWSVASAQEEAPSDDATEVEEPSFAPGREPAVMLEVGSEEAEDEAWTFRYLVPTVAALAAVVLAAVILHYGFRIRGRYRVVR